MAVAFFAIGCIRNKASQSVRVIEINPEVSTKNGFSDFFELENYIVLESSDSSFMQDIRKISVTDDKIFILTWGESKVLVFGKNGRFISCIDRNGRGPGEYNYVVDMSVLLDGNTVGLFDKGFRKVMYYDLKGDFQYETDLGVDLETFTMLPGGGFAGYSYLNYAEPLNDTIYQLWCFNKEGRVVNGFFPVKKDYLGNSMGLPSSFNHTMTGLYFIPYTENTIYKLTDNPLKLSPVYKIDFGEKTIPSDLLLMPYNEMQKAYEESYIVSGEFVGSKDLLFNIFSQKERKFLTAIYNFKTSDYALLGTEEIYDKDNELPVETGTQNSFTGADRLIAVVHPFRLLGQECKNIQSIGYKLKQTAKETDNPILVIYKEKDTK